MKRLKLIKTELAIVCVAIAIYCFAGLLIASVIGKFIESGVITGYLSYLISAAATYLFTDWFYESCEYGITETSFSGNSVKATAFGIVGSFAVANLVAGMIAILKSVGVGDWIVSTNTGSGYGELNNIEVLLVVIVSALAAPMVEELIFRGILLGALWKVFGMRKAVVISAVCFGLLHGTSVMTVLSATLAGVVLGYTFSITRNLMNTIIPHVVYNTFVTYLAVNTTDLCTQTQESVSPGALQDAIILFSVSLIVCAILVFVYKKYLVGEEDYYEENGRKM